MRCYIQKYRSPFGGITLAGDGETIAGLWFDGQKYYAENLPEEREEKDAPVFARAREWLDVYFSGKEPSFTPPLSSEGVSPFRKRVRKILLEIPYGRTATYGEIAARIACNEVDLLLLFRDPLTAKPHEPNDMNLLRLCDMHNIPVATNIATAEVLIHGLERGDLDWRNILNPKS